LYGVRIKFKFEERLIHKRTKATSEKVARHLEAEVRTELAKGNFGILAPAPPAPTLREFLTNEFVPFAKTAYGLCDGFTLTKISGHNSIAMTQRYCHPQVETVLRAVPEMTQNSARGSPTVVTANSRSCRQFIREASKLSVSRLLTSVGAHQPMDYV